MIAIENTLVSENLARVKFCCDLEKCHGACCVEGDAGAPLEMEEIGQLEDYIEKIQPYMKEKGIEMVKQVGVFDYDVEGNFVTPLINNKECAFVYFENSIARCAIEKAYEKKAIPFPKPVSCHLYPVRISRFKNFEGVNYHKWDICEKALKKGKKENIPLYRFLKDSLKRYFGEKWYNRLVQLIEKNRKSR